MPCQLSGVNPSRCVEGEGAWARTCFPIVHPALRMLGCGQPMPRIHLPDLRKWLVVMLPARSWPEPAPAIRELLACSQIEDKCWRLHFFRIIPSMGPCTWLWLPTAISLLVLGVAEPLRPRNYTRPPPASDLDLDHMRLRRLREAQQPEQIHLALAGKLWMQS